MPFLRRNSQPAPPPEPSEWRPQPFGHRSFRTVSDPLIEPCWSGLRVLARLDRLPSGEATTVLTDEEGADCTAEFAAVAQAIASALRADDAILDGYLTVEPTQDTVGVAPGLPGGPTQTQMVSQMLVGSLGSSRDRKPDDKPQLDAERPIAFVAVDVLRIDGSSLVDLPLLERKRLLDGALEPGELVRVTPYVRSPAGSHAQTWYAQGFREMALKPANSRYRPTGEPGDWAIAPIRRG